MSSVDTARILGTMTKTQAKPQSSKYVSRKIAADVLGVSLRSIKRYMDAGDLDYVRDIKGGRVWITRTSVDAVKKKGAAKG